MPLRVKHRWESSTTPPPFRKHRGEWRERGFSNWELMTLSPSITHFIRLANGVDVLISNVSCSKNADKKYSWKINSVRIPSVHWIEHYHYHYHWLDSICVTFGLFDPGINSASSSGWISCSTTTCKCLRKWNPSTSVWRDGTSNKMHLQAQQSPSLSLSNSQDFTIHTLKGNQPTFNHPSWKLPASFSSLGGGNKDSSWTTSSSLCTGNIKATAGEGGGDGGIGGST